MKNPAAVYAELRSSRQEEIARLERRHAKLGYLRLATVVGAAVVAWYALAGGFSILWLLVPAAAFIALMAAHERLLHQLERQRRAERFFDRGLARLRGDWAGHGETGERYLNSTHPYAPDLDIFGKASLFELLSTARTHVGEDTLAGWLQEPAPPEIVRARQAAVDELRPRLDLRESLAVVAEEARTGVDPVALAHWGEAPAQLAGAGLHAAVWAFRIFGVAALALGFVGLAGLFGARGVPEGLVIAGRDFVLLALLANGIFFYRIRPRMEAVVGAVDAAAHELGLVSEVLLLLEPEKFHAPLLVELRASLDTDGSPPSQRLKRLGRITACLDSRDNMILRVLERFILWTPYWAMEAEKWRRESGPAVRRWLTALGAIEALSSLASHAFEHPDDPFPEFAPEGPWLEAEGVAHPLIAEDRAVRNDVRLGGELRVLIVSGSNMSGKSTLLRTLGSNVVLAQAGATVRARRLRLSPLALGASIRVTDSLHEGVSRFYAEILRLRQILDEASGKVPGKPPLLFLIDEFLHGTNSHDRRIGAEAMVRGLVKRGAVGLITTHDLALADIADGLGERAANVHFEDRVENGRIEFDYVMRPGIVRKSNAIELMRSVGLEV
jgi:MutS domain V